MERTFKAGSRELATRSVASKRLFKPLKTALFSPLRR